ncbi:hypothetical protein SAMN05661008_00345 [Alkalithermobacter thermoalcaliphilus JW-YL-7 = DSM 7308]|uniref:Uncharacterized protein n=1 Tax=Alkalithermobacter thermoalcaliphilus JW-YL-7 = DSM 7308 TaxID=1121328 RepID=A0A150FPC6_CLOPD|nr:hypothetical protein JWYL7_0544 [[Clostridium] paradoxum JW-YL-7 = DSM 7308]SHK50491.1 hypothetical protein SAMN05661008_00345 [[Clostridium] paradoxum JW-YL-7 = DSM 7308]
MMKIMIIGALLIAYLAGRIAVGCIENEEKKTKIGAKINLFFFCLGIGISILS